MKQTVTILKNINFLNLLLLTIAIVLFFLMDYPLLNKKIKVSIPPIKESSAQSEQAVAAAENIYAYSDYVTIADKNLFHPERKVISNKNEQVLVRPEIVLYGTLITSEKKVAYIEDKKNPYSTPGRGKRQITVNEGGMVAGYKLTEVNSESIVLMHGEDKMLVTLATQKNRNQTDTPPGIQTANQPTIATEQKAGSVNYNILPPAQLPPQMIGPNAQVPHQRRLSVPLRRPLPDQVP